MASKSPSTGTKSRCRAACEALRRCRPPILLEVHPGRVREEGASLAALTQMLTDLGYRAESADGGAVQLAAITTFTTDQRLVLTVAERGSI